MGAGVCCVRLLAAVAAPPVPCLVLGANCRCRLPFLQPTSRWACKLCGEKQSLQRVFARSHSAKDCRLVVQRYNTARGAVEAEDTERALETAAAAEAGGWAEEDAWEEEQGGEQWGQQQSGQQQQRWQAFQDEADEVG